MSLRYVRKLLHVLDLRRPQGSKEAFKSGGKVSLRRRRGEQSYITSCVNHSCTCERYHPESEDVLQGLDQ